MADVSLTWTLSNDPPNTNIVDADQLMDNFNDLKDALNDLDLASGGPTNGIHPAILGIVPAARVYHSVNQSIPNGAATILAFNSERFDTDTIHDNATNNSRLTCKTAGLYVISLSIRWAINSSGVRTVGIKRNGTTNLAGQGAPSIGGSNEHSLTVSTVASLAVNDYVEAEVFQNSGGALNVESIAERTPEFSMVRVGKIV